MAVARDTKGSESGQAAASRDTKGSDSGLAAVSKWTFGANLCEADLNNLVRGADRNFVLPHTGYDESLSEGSLPDDSAGRNKRDHLHLDKEITHPPLYEKLSDYIHVDRELEPFEVPWAFDLALLWNTEIKSDVAGLQMKGKSKAKTSLPTWLPLPPHDYVRSPGPGGMFLLASYLLPTHHMKII